MRRHLIAAFVLLHMLAVTLMAIPAPGGGMQRSAWKDETVQEEFKAWTQRLNQLGFQLTTEQFEEELWAFAREYMQARRSVLKPFRLYYRYTGSTQSWRMFVAPHRFPAKLEISVREGGQWRSVYLARDPELDWRERQLGHDRFRSAIFRFAWPPYRKQYDDFCEWIAGVAAQDFPEADKVRLRFYKYRTPTPQQVRAGTQPEGRWIRARTLSLEGRSG